MNSNILTPLLHEMLQEMQNILSREDIKAGLPSPIHPVHDASVLYVEWCELKRNYNRQKQIIEDLDKDISKMQPWGDFPMSRIDQLAQSGQQLDFWKSNESTFKANHQLWADSYQAEVINTIDGICYFVTTTPIDAAIVIPEAEMMTVTPSPVSTLISLQTRAKDSLRNVIVKQGDFAMEHYLEIEAALGLHDTLVIPSKRHKLMSKLKKIIRKV